MAFRTCTILVVALASFAGGGLGTSNGMVLCIDSDGHLALEPPHLSHAHRHAHGGADHEPLDHGREADHGDLHGLMASCSDSVVSVQRAENASASLAALEYLSDLELWLPVGAQATLPPSAEAPALADSTFRGGTARLELACLASVVLLV